MSTIGLVFVVGSILALVYFPTTLTGDQGGRSYDRSTVLATPTPVATTEWGQANVPGSFGVTPALDVTGISPSGTAELHVLVGRNTGTNNTYQVHSCGPIPAQLGPGGELRVIVPESNTCTQGSDITALNGYCCASQNGYGVDDFVRALAEPSDTTIRELSIPDTPPYQPTTVAVAPGGHVSSTMEFVANLFLGSTYNNGTGRVELYTRPPGGSWSQLSTVPCAGPFAGDHWGVTGSPDGEHAFTICRNGPVVSVTQTDTSTGVNNWTYPLDTVPSPPSGFYYYQCCHTGPIRFPDGSTGDALACSTPSDDIIRGSIVGKVGELTPPTIIQSTTFPGAVPDRQAFTCEGPMVFHHGAHPDGTGVRTIAMNCASLTGPCSSMVWEDTSRSPQFASFIPPYAFYQATPLPVIEDRMIVVEGGNGTVGYYTLNLPMSFFDNEDGTLDQWHGVVGGVP